jgi:hypothetical protein
MDGSSTFLLLPLISTEIVEDRLPSCRFPATGDATFLSNSVEAGIAGSPYPALLHAGFKIVNCDTDCPHKRSLPKQ